MVTALRQHFADPRHGKHVRASVFLAAALAVTVGLWPSTELRAKDKDRIPKRAVNGLVLDPQDNPISGATVTLTDLKEGKQIASYTGDDGSYSFSGLEMTNSYEVQAVHNGVTSRSRRISIIDTRSRLTLNLHIPPAAEDQ